MNLKAVMAAESQMEKRKFSSEENSWLGVDSSVIFTPHKLLWILKFILMCGLVLYLTSWPQGVDALRSFSHTFDSLHLEPESSVIDLDRDSFHSIVEEYRTVFVYFSFKQNQKSKAIMQTLEVSPFLILPLVLAALWARDFSHI